MAARTLINMQPLPPRDGALNREQADRDIREAMAAGSRAIEGRAQRYVVSGWQPEEPQFDVRDHTIVVSLRLTRE